MHYLTKADFIFINQQTIQVHGGNYVSPHNFLNEGNLDYLIEIVQKTIFGKDVYPDLPSKAAVYFYNTIQNHIFQDGNKRTGLGAMQLFLDYNGFKLNDGVRLERTIPRRSNRKLIKLSSEANERVSMLSVPIYLYDFVMETASGKIDLETCTAWIRENIEKKDD